MTVAKRIAVQMDIDAAYKRHTAVFAGIHRYAIEQGWNLIVDEWADHTLPGNSRRPIPYDGYIGRISRQGSIRARRLGVPAVNVWMNSPAADELPGVFPDFRQGGQLRAEHLLGRGFRNFGVIYRSAHIATALEMQSFVETVRTAQCSSVEVLNDQMPGNDATGQSDTYEGWQWLVRALDAWLDRICRPVGLYIYNVTTARVVIEMCRERGWRVPDDVAIVSGQNEETICERPSPGITSLEVPYEQIGYEAARMLDHIIKRNQHPQSRQTHPDRTKRFLPPVGIVARRSTDHHAVEDPFVRRVLRMIDENLHRPISIDEIAQEMSVSRRSLTSRFRLHMETSIAAEICRLRLERAKRELTTSDQSIKRISFVTGFASPRALLKAFQKHVGCSPAMYRSRNQ